MLVRTSDPGTGNSKVNVTKHKMVELNNTPITKREIQDFLNRIEKPNIKE